jgi:hypothetical protein
VNTIADSYPPFYIHLDIPASFRSKAQYALNTMLSGYKVSPQYVGREVVEANGGLIYGLQLHSESQAEAGVLGIQSRPETWAYFESDQPYDVEQVVRLESTVGDGAEELPVLFGEAKVHQQERSITVRTDLVASAFFWLSDWQERYVIERDQHGRIPYRATLQHALNVGERALVNEYAAQLAHWLEQLGYNIAPKSWPNGKYALALTFDLDNVRKNRITSGWAKTKDLWASKPKRQNFSRWGSALRQAVTPGNPTHKSIQKLFGQLDERAIHSTVFLKSIIERSEFDARDYLQTSFFNNLIARLKAEGHEIAFHSSYDGGVEPALLKAELEQLQSIGDVNEIVSHRAHYLRYNPDILPDELSVAGIQLDSSMGWADQIGFRTGCCWPHRWYHLEKDQATDLWEIPMTAMDIQLMSYMRLNTEQAVERICTQIDTVKRWNGIAVWNFHQHIYDPVEAPGWDEVFERALAYALNEQPTITTFSELHELWMEQS